MTQTIRSAKVGPRRSNGFDIRSRRHRHGGSLRSDRRWSGLFRMLIITMGFKRLLIIVRMTERYEGLTPGTSRHLHMHETQFRKVCNGEHEQDDRYHEPHRDLCESRQQTFPERLEPEE